MKSDAWVHWSQWSDGGMVAFGQMPKLDMQNRLHEFEKEARKLLKRTGADHVVFGIKRFDENGKLEEIRFYLKPMGDEEFYQTTGNLRACQVYALHKMPNSSTAE